jgi:hypothetical protein
MALDFPASPTDGEVYQNWIYSTDKGAWKAKPLTAAKTLTSDTPPGSPSNGDQWFNTIDGTLYIYVTDVDGSQWVESRAPITADGYTSPNYIINGGMDIWQRGTSQTTPANGNYTADRFRTTNNGNGTRVYSQLSFAGDGPSGTALLNYFRYQQTAAGTGATYNGIAQRIENVGTLAGQTSTFSFYAKADAARTISVGGYQDSGASGTGSASFPFTQSTFALSTAWQRFSATVTIPSISGRTIGANSFLEISISFPLNALQTIDIAGVQLESGAVASTFRRNANSIQGELAACQRYYQRYAGVLSANRLCFGFQLNTTQATTIVAVPVVMRANPAVTFSSLVWTDAVAFDATVSAANTTNSTASTPVINWTYAANGTARWPGFIAASAVGGYFDLSAEL